MLLLCSVIFATATWAHEDWIDSNGCVSSVQVLNFGSVFVSCWFFMFIFIYVYIIYIYIYIHYTLYIFHNVHMFT